MVSENSFFCDKYNEILRFGWLAGWPGLDAALGLEWPCAFVGLIGRLASCLLFLGLVTPAGWLPAWLGLASLLDSLGGLRGLGPRNAVHLSKGYAPGYAPVCTERGPSIKMVCARVCAGMRQITMSLSPWPGWLACLIISPRPAWLAGLPDWLASHGLAG